MELVKLKPLASFVCLAPTSTCSNEVGVKGTSQDWRGGAPPPSAFYATARNLRSGMADTLDLILAQRWPLRSSGPMALARVYLIILQVYLIILQVYLISQLHNAAVTSHPRSYEEQWPLVHD
uniref:Uncharacterized protein n=1 Tax=Sorghum bicolor TaxID=4558 RepID=Q9XE88_SORBI|nr:hypothetical protein [Sorghum bicolor]